MSHAVRRLFLYVSVLVIALSTALHVFGGLTNALEVAEEDTSTTKQGAIRKISLKDGKVTTLVNGLNGPFAIAVHDTHLFLRLRF